MKIRTIILVALLIIGITVSSCSRKLCPAYSKAATEQISGKS